MTAFYTPDGDGFVAQPLTRGPWSDLHQHAGPPSALLARAAEARLPGMALARVTVEMLRPVPLGRVTVAVEVDKVGRKASTLTGTLACEGAVCLVARMVCVREADTSALEVAHPVHAPLPLDCPPFAFSFFRCEVGYHTAVEARRARGVWGAGDMALWMRPRVPLVEGEPTSPAQRVLVVADAGSGVTAALDPAQASFLNADLTVHLLRAPVGEWVLVDGQTTVGSEGRALADCRLGDVRGTVGRGCQSLVVEQRAPSPGAAEGSAP